MSNDNTTNYNKLFSERFWLVTLPLNWDANQAQIESVFSYSQYIVLRNNVKPTQLLLGAGSSFIPPSLNPLMALEPIRLETRECLDQLKPTSRPSSNSWRGHICMSTNCRTPANNKRHRTTHTLGHTRKCIPRVHSQQQNKTNFKIDHEI